MLEVKLNPAFTCILQRNGKGWFSKIKKLIVAAAFLFTIFYLHFLFWIWKRIWIALGNWIKLITVFLFFAEDDQVCLEKVRKVWNIYNIGSLERYLTLFWYLHLMKSINSWYWFHFSMIFIHFFLIF